MDLFTPCCYLFLKVAMKIAFFHRDSVSYIGSNKFFIIKFCEIHYNYNSFLKFFFFFNNKSLLIFFFGNFYLEMTFDLKFSKEDKLF